MFATTGSSAVRRTVHSAVRWMSSTAKKEDCICRVALGSIRSSFESRTLGSDPVFSNCAYLKSERVFKGNPTCRAQKKTEVVAALKLMIPSGTFRDVIAFHPDSSQVPLDPLAKRIDVTIGDFRGDFGLYAAPELVRLIKEGIIGSIGGIIDIGGMNAETIKLFRKLLGDENLKGVIIDMNPIIPALTKAEENTKYAIGSASVLLSEEPYRTAILSAVKSDEPKLFLLNNLISAIDSPAAAWELIETCMDCADGGDHLFMINLSKEHFEAMKHASTIEEDGGIMSYSLSGKRGKKEFFKSAVDADFFNYKATAFMDVDVVHEKSFSRRMQNSRGNVFDGEFVQVLLRKKG